MSRAILNRDWTPVAAWRQMRISSSNGTLPIPGREHTRHIAQVSVQRAARKTGAAESCHMPKFAALGLGLR